jgi:hypothetical protein
MSFCRCRNLTIRSISRQSTFASIQNHTGLVEVSRAFCWLNPTKAKFCPTGNSKPQTLPVSLPIKSTACFYNTKPKAILWAWIWRESFCRWGIRDRVAMPITNQDASTQPTLKRFYPVKQIRSKLSLPGFFMSRGNRRRLILCICN